MMFGGGMTLAPARSAGVLGIGLLMMLIFIGLPVLLIMPLSPG